MARWLAIVFAAVWLVAGCSGGAQPPRGPEYTPVNSPEAQSPCPAEWKEAKAAREAAIGSKSVELTTKVAVAVFAQGECELSKFGEVRIGGGEMAAIVAEIGVVRRRFSDVANLFVEVVRYPVGYRAAGNARAGDLRVAYAAKLAAVPLPTDLPPSERAPFSAEMRDVISQLRVEAAESYGRAVETSNDSGEVEGARWKAHACAALGQLGASTAGCR